MVQPTALLEGDKTFYDIELDCTSSEQFWPCKREKERKDKSML